MTFDKGTILVMGFLLQGFCSQAQLTVKTGGIFSMQTGAQLTVQGNVDNGGTLLNEGTLKVQGNFYNTGNYIGTAGFLELYGVGNADLNTGASPVANMIINKTVSSDRVRLLSSATVTGSFTLTNGIFTTDPINNPAARLVSPVTATYSFAPGKEIIGAVTKTGFTPGVAHVFNQPNMRLTIHGGTTPADVTVTMIPQNGGGDPTLDEREVKRKFTFAQNGGTGFTADIRYPYSGTELNTNTEANLVPWHKVGSEWNARLAAVTTDLSNDYVQTTGIPAADLANEWKLADPTYSMVITAFLRGPWNGVSVMNSTLNTAGLIPLDQPYHVSPFNYAGNEKVAAVPANVVDWVLVEHRKPLSGLPQDALLASVTGRKAGFLLSNGKVVERDGVTPILMTITKQGTGFLVLRHRNHLGVLSNPVASNAAGIFTNDFTILANVYKPAGATSDPLVLLPGNTGKFGLWAGDANANGSVNVTDLSAVKTAIANSLAGYHLSDINLSNSINATDVSFTKSTIAVPGTGSGTNSLKPNKDKTIQTNIPGGTRD